LDESRIAEITRDVARGTLRPRWFRDAQVEPALDSDGNEAVRITIVIAPGAVRKLGGEAILDTLVELRRRLEAEGEVRFPLVEYATEAELSDSGDSES